MSRLSSVLFDVSADRRGGPTDDEEMAVLLVDDDPDSMSVLRRALREDGVRVLPCSDAESALAVAQRAPPDLTILDLELPGMSGFEAARELRGNDLTCHVPILVLSGHADEQSRIAAYASGADCFLGKPFRLDELRAVVQSLGVRGRQARDVEDGCAVLYALADIVDIRSLDARGHMERSARLARAFGSFLDLPDGDLLALERAGYLHDIGKVGIPFEVLNKGGPLTPEERETMQQHPLIGARICERLQTLRAVVPIIRHHHEKWDGSGYPYGLQASAIPLLARVFQVVDVFEALVSARCYKEAMPVSEALAVLTEESELGYWDRDLVDRFAEALCGGWFGYAPTSAG